ncbi:hypothetical protein CHARACLAT_021481 [Characodon lateralis]|uniref:Uncharacterized protein n=1 Tax=Characodon lateralis TaxID=208331 RepID=A0ABU7EYT0_9TELE|nr:hypothetical protein [Characodon lateralis]
MLRDCFTASGNGALQKKGNYFKILQLQFRSTVRWLNLGDIWFFQQDSDPKHIWKKHSSSTQLKTCIYLFLIAECIPGKQPIQKSRRPARIVLGPS